MSIVNMSLVNMFSFLFPTFDDKADKAMLPGIFKKDPDFAIGAYGAGSCPGGGRWCSWPSDCRTAGTRRDGGGGMCSEKMGDSTSKHGDFIIFILDFTGLNAFHGKTGAT